MHADTIAYTDPIISQPFVRPSVRRWPDHVELNASADFASGYGSFVRQIRRGLLANGITLSDHKMLDIIRTMPLEPYEPRLVHGPGGVPRWVDVDGEGVKFGTKGRAWAMNHALLTLPEDFIVHEPGNRDAVRLAVGLPEGAIYAGANRRVLFTMWESTEIPRRMRPWAPHLRRTNLVLVPAEHSRQVIHDVCPDVRVEVCPLGLDVEDWPYLDRSGRSDDRPYIFLMVGDLSHRKGYIQAYQAFRRVFGDSRDAVLVYKVRGGSDLNMIVHKGKTTQVWDDEGNVLRNGDGSPALVWNREPVRWRLHTKDANVKTLRGDWRRKTLLELYQAADCFVWPTLGEGWGYPPREAAATGLPVITCAHTGQADAAEWAYTIPHTVGGARAIFNTWGGDCGTFPTPDVDALAERMRWVFEHRDEAREFGRRASAVVGRRTSADVARDILDLAATI